MTKIKTDDALTLKIRELRKKAREKVKGVLLKECETYKSEGRYPWEGIWLHPQDIRKVQQKMKKRDKIIFIEVLFIFFIFCFISFALYRLMKIFLLP